MATKHTNYSSIILPAAPVRTAQNGEKEQAHVNKALDLALLVDNWQNVLARLRTHARGQKKTMAEVVKHFAWYQPSLSADKVYLVSPTTIMVPSESLNRSHFPLYFLSGTTPAETQARYAKACERWSQSEIPENPGIAAPKSDPSERFLSAINRATTAAPVAAAMPPLIDPLSLLSNASKSIESNDDQDADDDDDDYEFNEI